MNQNETGAAPENATKTYAVMFTAPRTDELGTPSGETLLESLAALEVQKDGYSYASFDPKTRENLHSLLGEYRQAKARITELRALWKGAVGIAEKYEAERDALRERVRELEAEQKRFSLSTLPPIEDILAAEAEMEAMQND